MADKCPICTEEEEDMRHVMVECFYQVDEIVPQSQPTKFFKEVTQDGTYLGLTRRYSEGTRDEHFVEEETFTEAGNPLTKIGIKQVPIDPIRLLELTGFNLTCCKACRGDFLMMLKDWADGKKVPRWR